MAPQKKKRADLLLVEQGHCPDIDAARKLLLAGRVRVGPDHVVGPAETLPADVEFNLPVPCPYVSRGAFKLLPALDKHLPDLTGLAVLDIGASTGGFTDLVLQRGARVVFAIDSGTGQLAQKLRGDPRVISRERTNARYLKPDDFPELAQVLTMDVSFISATALLGAADGLLAPGAWAFVLVKPQFEAARDEVEVGGVVRDDAVRQRVNEEVDTFVSERLGWEVVDHIPSPITGPKGNQETLAVYKKLAN